MRKNIASGVVRSAVVFFGAVALLRAFAAGVVEAGRVDYLLLSPPDFIADWTWYAGERAKTHTNLTFAVKNTAEIYAEYPFGPTNACRNAAESIHAYLRDSHPVMRFEYVVLGGAWLDAQNRLGYTPYFATGEAMSLSNCVPGIYGYPREDWRAIPSDLFYGCLAMKEGQKYPWDANGDGKYIDKDDCANNNLWPTVCVSRITLNPFSGVSGKVYNQHTLISNYVAKLKRGEDRHFAGHYRYGMSVASTGSSKLRKTGDRMCYTELEFYDGMYNMFDPRHHDSLEDGEGSTRLRYFEQFSMWRPLRSVTGMMSYTWTGGLPTLAAAMDDYYASDRDFGYVQAHGWAQGAAQFSAYRFATAKGLTLFNGGSGPCETGYPDYHVSSGSRKVLQYNVGDAAVTNPDGGALASVNNSRWSWAGGGGGFAAMSYYMLNQMLIGFNELRLDVGHAWLKGVQDYWPAGRWGNTAGWVLSEQFLYGDPLVRLPAVPDVWWTGGETGVWDCVASNWTNSTDAATTFDAANNVLFNVQSNLALDVAGEIAAMRLSLPAWEEDAFLSFAGTGSLRVMQAVDVAGTNALLHFDVAGGVGHDGIRFLTGAGDLVFTGTNAFYVGGVRNAREVALLGGGVTLDVDVFPSGAFPLAFDGPGAAALPLPNVLRSAKVGGLNRFGPLAISNSYVKLSTVDAFGNGAPTTHILSGSELEIGANVYYQRSGFPEGLNATFLVDGASAVSSSVGGLWTVKHTTTFALGAPTAAGPTHLALAAETADGGGRIVITNAVTAADDPQAVSAFTNTVEIADAVSLAGDVTVGANLRLVLGELPFKNVTSLTVGDGATVVLPDDASGYWQIVPVSSKFTCGNNVTFTTASEPDTPLDGSPSATGAFFREGALYRWTGTEGDWNLYFANRHPKILFGDLAAAGDNAPGDLAANVVTVRVATAVSPEFAFFSNLHTKYVFDAADDEAAVIFSSIYFYGPTEFVAPVAATEYVDIATGTSRFDCVDAPYVHVAAGAGLALAGSHWTAFRLDADAVLVAVPDDVLDWNADTTIAFPDHGTVRIDVGALSLSDEPQPLIAGRGHTWTLADLKRFSLVQEEAELRIVDNTLCVVAGENLKGPYALYFEGTTNWNCSAWSATNGPAGRMTLPRVWADCATDWSADALVSIPTNAQPSTLNTPLTLAVDCDVHVNTLSVNAATNDFVLRAEGDVTAIDVATLDLSECHGATEIGVGTGTAAILTSTNEGAVVHFTSAVAGTLAIDGATVVLDRPGDVTLNAGAQGTLRIIAPQAYERFRVAKVPADFETGGLRLVVTDARGTVLDGFGTTVADGALWCVPPALEALVPSGTNDLTRLEWRDVLGNVVSNVDWTAAAGFRLVGTETSGVVIAKSGFASVWSRLSVSNEVTLYGNETLSPAAIPGGNGVLALAGAFTVKADVNASPNLLSGAKLKLHAGTTLEIRHRATSYNATGQDWRGITGTGCVRFADDVNTWIALPEQCFADTLTVETVSDLVLTEGVGAAHPLGVRNLTGSGRFRSDWGTGNRERPVRTVQTGVSAFSGYFHKKDNNRTATLVVASDDAVASTNKALILNGAAIEEHALTIETNGCVILTGSWLGPITVEGILVITNACATNGLAVTVRNGGDVRLVAEDAVPSVTAAAAYVAPTYPEEETSGETSATEDPRVRILCAAVGAGNTTWTRLDWRGTNGVAVASDDIDWSYVTNVTLTATNGTGRVVADAETFVGVVRMTVVAGASTASAPVLEVRERTPFAVTKDSVGTVDFRLEPVPTSSVDLLYLEASGTSAETAAPALAVTVHDRYGRVLTVAGEVTYDATARKYWLNVQNVNSPNYSCTFDTQYEDSLTSPLWFNGSGNLTYKARPEFFEDSRTGRALKGTSMNSFSMHSHNGNPTVAMDNVYVWSLHFVAKLPTNDGGIIFGWGNKDSGNGVCLARTSANVAGVYAWENGGAVRLVASADVPYASTQFHAYAITYDGTTLRFYVDGVFRAENALGGKYPTRGFYQWFKLYGQNGRLQNGPTSVVDDFRLYLYCLTPSSVRVIANDFPPWPEVPSAGVDCANIGWDDLYWSAEAAAGASVTLRGEGGSLVLDAPVAVAHPLTVTGAAVPITVTGTGVLAVTNGLSVTETAGLTFDCAGLDGTNLASYAVAGVPYARWILRGAYSGPVDVTSLPAVPEGYAVRVEELAQYGVRLVFTAPRYAFADSVGISVGAESFSGLSGDVGLHPTSATNWFPYATWTNTSTSVGGLSVVGSEGGQVDGQAPYGDDTSVARYFLHTSFDGNNDTYNGTTNGLALAGLSARFDRYRVLVYLATDTTGAQFGPVTIDGRTYCGVSAGDETSSATVSDSTALAWGKARFTAASEGVNVVISDVLTNDAVSVSAQRLKNNGTYARAQIAAVQIVKVGEIHPFTGTRYAADVTADTDWANGTGSGLVHAETWQNDPFSTITLTAKVDRAVLTFDTAVTAETVRVVSEAGRALTLQGAAEAMAVEVYDLSSSEGTVTFAGGLATNGTCVLATGPKGTLAFVVDDVSADQRLMRLASDFDYGATNYTVSVCDAQGNPPPDSWAALPLGGWLVLQRRDVARPWYALTFEDALDTTYGEARVVPLTPEGTASYVAARGGKALTGATPYTSPRMESVPDAWTIHAVARMPEESQGLLFGYGCKGERGVGLATVDADTVAVAWWDSRGRFTVIYADVPQATCQYHAYALVSSGAGVSLYVDGAFTGYSATSVNPASACLQIGSVQGGIVSGFTKTTTGALDDWRLYDGVLSADAIATLAAQFRPWPEYRTADLTAERTAWEDLVWGGAEGDDKPYLLAGRGGTLILTNVCELTNTFVATRAALTLVVSGDGALVSDAGLSFPAGWNIDCSGLDGTNLAQQATSGAPYVRWLVQGAYEGGDPTVTGLPAVPDGYRIASACDPARGVCLVLTIRADYVANLTNTTAWAAGKGTGLDVLADAWANDISSTLTLTQKTACATLTFDTAVTADVFKVVSEEGQFLTLATNGAALAAAQYDFTEAFGNVTLSNDVPAGTLLDLGRATVFAGTMAGTLHSAPEGASVRYEKAGVILNVAQLAEGVTNAFADATVTGDFANNARIYAVRTNDVLTLRPADGTTAALNGVVTVEAGGTLAVTSLGRANVASEVILDGGVFTACADATSALLVTVATNATIAADAGVTHTVAGTLAGDGAITVGTADRTGCVVFATETAFAHAIEVVGGVLDIGTFRPATPIALKGGKLRIRLTEEQEQAFDTVTLLALPEGAKATDYIVCGHTGLPLETEWVTVEASGEGTVLKVDTRGMDFSSYVMPLHGTMTAGKAWAEQTWTDSSSVPQRVPTAYWGSASNVIAIIDIAEDAEVAVAACVTNVTVTGYGTVVTDGAWPNVNGLTDAEHWHGTVRIVNIPANKSTGNAGCTFVGLGNATSTVELDGFAGWLNGCSASGANNLGTEHPYTLRIGAGGVWLSDGNSDQTYTFAHLAGTGLFHVGKESDGPRMRVVARESASFFGQLFVTGNAGVTLGTPTKNPSAGQIVVAAGATAHVTDGAFWKAANSDLEVAAGATLDVRTATAASRYTILRGTLTLSSEALLTVNGGADERDAWSTIGGDIVQDVLLLRPTEPTSVTFDTAVTASILRVKSPAEAPLTLAATTDAAAFATLDFAKAQGTVTLSNTFGATALTLGADTRIFGGRGALTFAVESGQKLTLGETVDWQSGDSVAAGGCVRFLRTCSAPVVTTTGMIGSYRQADFGAIASYNWVLRTEEPDDVVTLAAAGNYTHHVAIDVRGGLVTYDSGGSTQTFYGGNNTSGTNSVITVNGGTFLCDATGMAKANSNRGFLFGTTGNKRQNPTIVVNAGTFDCAAGQLTPWEYGVIIQNGGLIRARGIYKGGNNAGRMELNGGTVEIGDGGIAADSNSKFPTTLAGGTIKAVSNAEVKVAMSLTKPSYLAAADGKTLTVSGTVTGKDAAALTLGAAGAAGKVVIANATAPGDVTVAAGEAAFTSVTGIGSVTIEAGTKLSLPFGVVTGDLTVGAGATLNLVRSGTFTEITNVICAGTLTLPKDATLLLNGTALPDYCTCEGSAILVDIEDRTWTNPVTGAAQTFDYRFTGTTSGDWETRANWERFVTYDWQTLTGSEILPMVHDGAYKPTVIDGAFIASAANRTVALTGTMEGWAPQLAVLNGATVTVHVIKKMQSSPKWFWVDETSRLTIESLGGETYSDTLDLYVAASNGVTFATDLGGNTTTFRYYLKGAGSVAYGASLTKCPHQICRADIQLNGTGLGRKIRSKRLVTFAQNATVAFTAPAATVVAEDPLGEVSAGTLCAAISVSDRLGSCVITQRTDGVWIDYVDRGEGDVFYHEVVETDAVHQVSIPMPWLLQLTNGADRVLAPHDLTPVTVAAALESTKTANGLKPWESYVLGLEPTNAADRVTARVALEDGKIHVTAHGLDAAKFRGISKVRYVLEATDDLANPFTTLMEAQDASAFENLSADLPSRFYRIKVELVFP